MSAEKTYRIGEVAEMLGLKTHVLRFWETEFPQIEPLRTDKGQRLYTESNVAVLRRIQQLLHEQGMTIDGARRLLDGEPFSEENPERSMNAALLLMVERELTAIKEILTIPENP